ncbi:MAG: carboxypeptidase-like regulatory domain-containing protein [Acidobacteriota bacterium]
MRWKAAYAAGVNLIATDQFEDMAAVLSGGKLEMNRIILTLLLLGACAFGQTDSGTIRVLATDPTSAPIVDVTVTLTNVDTGVKTVRETQSEGYAIFSPIVRGNYVAEVVKSGFRTARIKDVTLEIDERKLIQVELAIASVSETIEVSAAAEVIQTEQAALGQVIQGSVAVQLPLAARRYTDLALLVPGATESTVLTTTRGPGWFVVNGNYQAQNNFIVDGVDNNQGTTNAQALSAQVVQPSPGRDQ